MERREDPSPRPGEGDDEDDERRIVAEIIARRAELARANDPGDTLRFGEWLDAILNNKIRLNRTHGSGRPCWTPAMEPPRGTPGPCPVCLGRPPGLAVCITCGAWRFDHLLPKVAAPKAKKYRPNGRLKGGR